jgi:cobalt/nickel transport system ATP-binding protein
MELSDANISKIRSSVGLVFQDPDSQLFMPTVFEDVAFGPLNMELQKEEVKAAVRRALEQVDMPGFGDRASHHLSLGEKRRISIATVLSMGPRLIVLDEPSSNLDPRHRRGLIALINGRAETKIIATHDIDLVSQCCSRVVYFEKGRIRADGPTQEVLNNINL